MTEYKSLDRVLEFATVPASVPLSEVYRGVALPPEPPAPDDSTPAR